MNILAYEAATFWNRGIPCISFKTRIQLYLLRSFFYCLTYCIKEFMIGKLFWKLNENSAGILGSYGLKQANPLQFFKTLIQLYLFYLFFYFWLTVSKRVSKAIFLDITFLSVGLWGRYGLKQGNPLQNPKISNQIVFVLSPELLFYLMYQKVYQR